MASSAIRWDEHRTVDGGFATQLIKLGHSNIDNDPLWSSRLLVTHPDDVRRTHLRFLQAGANIIITNTYNVNVDILMKHLKVDDIEAKNILMKAVHLAKVARDEYLKTVNVPENKRPLIAGSVGPYAVTRCDAAEYHGRYIEEISKQDITTWHRPRVAALVEAGVDLIAFETIPALDEAKALCELITEFPGTEAWLSFTLKDGDHTSHGEALTDCARLALDNPQIIGIGVNCCAPRYVADALRNFSLVRGKKALIVYSNSGEVWTKEHEWTGSADPTPIHSYVPEWMTLGANWIGGCCRVYDTDIAEIVRVMKGETCTGNTGV